MNPRTTLIHGLLLAVASLCAGSAFAARDVPRTTDDPEIHFDPSLVKQWKEADVAAPAYPQDADLIAVALGPTDTLKVYVDTKSISRAADRGLRLSLVVESSSGTRNYFFDGIRCETREYKTYVIGSPENNFVPIKKPTWQAIPRPTHFGLFYPNTTPAIAHPPPRSIRTMSWLDSNVAPTP